MASAQTFNETSVQPAAKTAADPRGKLPLEFEANKGQAAAEYGFVAHGPTYTLGISAKDIALSLHRSSSNLQSDDGKPSSIHLQLLGTNGHAKVQGLNPQPGISNYFIGNDPAKWQRKVPHFGKVEIGSAYPGIDLIFYGNPQQLEYDFRVAPGADPSLIRLNAQGSTSATLNAEGSLVLSTAMGDVQLERPDTYQEVGGVRISVKSEFRLLAKNTVGFSLGTYDHSKPLVIDPVLLYAVAFGGSNGNQGFGLDVDPAGNTYVVGNSCSSDFPTAASTFGTTTTDIAVEGCQNAFVTKLDPTASTLLYSDYIGGSVLQTATHIAVDATGNAYVTGATGSTDFPLLNNIGPGAPTPCALSTTGFNCPVGFVFKLSPDGSQLLFSSLLGGSGASGGFQMKLNPVSGDLLLLGHTNGTDFKPVPTTLQPSYVGGTCANSIPCFNSILLGFDPATGSLKYGTLFGSSMYTIFSGLTTDPTGDIYLSGSLNGTLAPELGTVTHTYPPAGATAGGADILVTRLHLSGTTLSTVYNTLIQGEMDDGGASVAVDASQNAYIFGSTASSHLPVTANAFQSTNTNTGGDDCMWRPGSAPLLPESCGTGFVAKLNSSGALTFLTYMGGNNQTYGEAVGVDSMGDIWLTGITSASDFPLSSDAYSLAGIGFQPPGPFNPFTPFLAEMSNDGTKVPFATAIATSAGRSTDVKIDANDNVYLTGFATAAPTSPNVYPGNPDAFNPIFVQKWNPGPQPVLQLSSTSLSFPATAFGATSATQAITLQNTGGGALELNLQLAGTNGVPLTFAETDNCGQSLAAGASCTVTATFQPNAPSAGCIASGLCSSNLSTATLTILTNTPTGISTVNLSGVTGQGAVVVVNPNPVVFPPQAAGTASAATTVYAVDYGDLPFTVSSATITGTNAADFQISSMGSCATPASNGCNLAITFNPAASSTGTRTASLVLADDAENGPQSIPLTGLVTSAGAGLLVSPVSIFTGPAFISSAIGGSGMFTLTNPSTDTDVQLTALALSGANAADFIVTPQTYPTTLPLTIAKGTSLIIDVAFLPGAGADGLRNATVTVGTNPAISGLPAIALSGDALAVTDPDVQLISVPSPQDFGSLQVGQISAPASHEFSLMSFYGSQGFCPTGVSVCGGPLTITSFTTGLSDYTILTPQQQSFCTAPPLTIPIGDSCTFYIQFTPSQAGNRNSTLTINSNDPMGPTTIPLLGAGLALPAASLSVTALNFGESAIGLASPPLTVQLQNTGQSNLTVSSVTATANYSVVSNTCTAAIAPGATCTIGVSFDPATAGISNGTLTIADSDYFGQQQTVALTGTGATGTLLRISPSSLNFGSQNNQSTSAPQTITLANTGNTIVTFASGGPRISNTDYAIGSSTCGSTLAIGATCAVAITFAPTTLYIDDGGVQFTDNALHNPQQVYFGGFGAMADGTPAVVITTSLNPAATGQAVTFNATVQKTSANAPVPTGMVEFFDGINAPIGSVNLNASGVGTVTTSSLAVGNHPVSVQYSGDLNYAQAASGVIAEVINAAASNPTTTTLITSKNPSSNGQLVIFTATIAGTGSTTTPVPTGTVMFLDGSTAIGTAALNGAGQALFSYQSPTAGSHSITAVYSGDGVYVTSTSSAVVQVVNTSTRTASSTSIASSLNPATAGQSVVFTATVASAGSSTTVPTGSVSFLDGTTTLGTGMLNGGGQASFSTSALVAGPHSITAVYGADSNYTASTSSVLAETITAPAKASTSTTLASSLNPATAGQSVVFTATVAGSGSASVPSGTVSFLDGMNTLGTGTLNGSGQATYATSTLAAGSHSITAVYGADTNFSASTSTAVTQVVNAAAKTATTTSLTSSLNPAIAGQSVMFTASVTAAGTNPAIATGTITFEDGTTTLGTASLNGSAQANFSTTALAVGSHSITAVYGADANFAASTSSALAETVTAVVSQANTSTSLSSSSNPAVIGQSVVLSVTVAGPSGGASAPTGSISFLDGSTSIGTGTLSAGSTSLTISTLAVGSHSITAQYGGDTNFLTSTSAVLTQTINAAPSFTAAVSPAALTVTRGQSGMVAVTIAPVGGFNQTVSFACSGLPQFSTCTFNPAMVTPASGAASAATTLTIATDVATASIAPESSLPSNNGFRILFAGSLMGFGLFAVARKGRKLTDRKRTRLLMVLLLVSLFGAAATQLIGCGGGSGAPPSDQTPTGTTSVIITASSGAETQSITLPLTVQ